MADPERIVARGRNRNKVLHDRILCDYFGRRAYTEDGVVHESVLALFDLKRFYKRYRMGPKLFSRLHHDISDPETGHEEFIEENDEEFMEEDDAMGGNGPSALQKLTAVMKLLADGMSFDAVDLQEEYTGVEEEDARAAMDGFLEWLDDEHEGSYLGVWTTKSVPTQKSMEKYEKHGEIGEI